METPLRQHAVFVEAMEASLPCERHSQFTQQTRFDLFSGCRSFQPTSVGQDCPRTLSCPFCWAQSPPSTFPFTYQVGQHWHRSNESPPCLRRVAAGTPDQPWIQGRNLQGINQWAWVGRRAEQQPMGACAAQWELLEQGRKGLHREMTGCRDKLAPFRSHFLLTLSPFLPKIKTCIVLKALRRQWISKVRN